MRVTSTYTSGTETAHKRGDSDRREGRQSEREEGRKEEKSKKERKEGSEDLSVKELNFNWGVENKCQGETW